MNRIAPSRDSLDFMDDIKDMDSGQIYNVLRFEQPQTIAFMLANLDVDKGSEVFTNDATNVQEQVIERVGAMETTHLPRFGLWQIPLEAELGKKVSPPKFFQAE